MTKQQAIKWAGSAAKLADLLGLTDGAVSQWGREPPLLQQYRIQSLSDSKLRVSEAQTKTPSAS